MTEPIVECVRECTRPCRCDDCTIADHDAPVHPPIPVEAETGLLCRRCADRLWAALHEIGDLYAGLDWNLVGDYGVSEGGGGGKVTGSPALVRLDVLALTDPRTQYDPAEPRGPLYVPNVVGKWAEVARRALGHTSTAGDLNSALWVLVAWWQQITHHVWIGQCHDEMVHVLGLLKNAHGLQPPRRARIGHCVGQVHRSSVVLTKVCGAPLYVDGGPVTCRSCGRQYVGLDLVRLYTKQQEGIAS